MTVRQTLVHAATRYDARQEANAKRSKRGYYNAYALAQYFARIDDVMDRIDAGEPPRVALCSNFNDRLLDCLLKAIGESPATPEEA